jgi:hypothetical protein
MPKPTYETDFYQWTQSQAAALRAKDLAALDLDNLAEEIESLGRSERYAIESQLTRLLHHLLKWCYDTASDPRRLWELSINDARREIAKRLTGSLREYPAHYLAEAYQHACKDAAIETGLPRTTFPETCPWSVDQILEEDFLPPVS